jgi:hypothetical protein
MLALAALHWLLDDGNDTALEWWVTGTLSRSSVHGQRAACDGLRLIRTWLMSDNDDGHTLNSQLL